MSAMTWLWSDALFGIDAEPCGPLFFPRRQRAEATEEAPVPAERHDRPAPFADLPFPQWVG